MSGSVWTQDRADYVVSQFDAGVHPLVILENLQKSGYPSLKIVTIEQCLRSTGRNVDGYNPHLRPAFTSNTHNPQGFGGQQIQYPGDSIVRHGTNSRPPYNPSSTFRPQSNQEKRWDLAAATYAINAYNQGHSVMEIWEALRSDGYVSNAAEIAASLNAQGVSSERLTDYLRR